MEYKYINNTGDGTNNTGDGAHHHHNCHFGCNYEEEMEKHFAACCEKDPDYPAKKAAKDNAILERMRKIKEERERRSGG